MCSERMRAMDQAGADNLDAIILDLMMPEMMTWSPWPACARKTRICRSSYSPARTSLPAIGGGLPQE